MRNVNAQIDDQNPFAVTSSGDTMAALAEDSERLGFIRKTYAHLAGAVLSLVALETVLFTVVPAETMGAIAAKMLGGWGWLIVLGAFMAVSWMARSWAESNTSRAMQYAGLGLYVVAEAVILLPMLYVCIELLNAPELPVMAALITTMCFIGLTAFVFTTRIDLASWGKYLAIAGIVAMCAIVAGIFTGFNLGLGFAAIMVGLSCAYIMYDTSNVLHHYHTSQYVAASLALFSSVVLLFWYILRILMMFASDD
jgi:FtsH-binding integral membrane protein